MHFLVRHMVRGEAPANERKVSMTNLNLGIKAAAKYTDS